MTDDPFLAPPPQPHEQPPQANAPAPYQPPPPPPPPAPVPGMYDQAGYAQPGYPPPPPGYAMQGYAMQGYPPPPMPYYGPVTKPKTWMNWVAFGCGLGALLTCVSFIPAIIFGHMGLAAAKRGEADKRGFGIAGLVMGYVYLVGLIAYIALVVGFLGASGGFSSY